MQPLTARLEGSIVVLEPLTEENAEELWEAAQAPEIWDWLANLNERDRFDRWLELTFEAVRAGTEGPFLTRGARLRDGDRQQPLPQRPARRTASSRSAGPGSTRAPGGPAPTSRRSC